MRRNARLNRPEWRMSWGKVFLKINTKKHGLITVSRWKRQGLVKA